MGALGLFVLRLRFVISCNIVSTVRQNGYLFIILRPVFNHFHCGYIGLTASGWNVQPLHINYITFCFQSQAELIRVGSELSFRVPAVYA